MAVYKILSKSKFQVPIFVLRYVRCVCFVCLRLPVRPCCSLWLVQHTDVVLVLYKKKNYELIAGL